MVLTTGAIRSSSAGLVGTLDTAGAAAAAAG